MVETGMVAPSAPRPGRHGKQSEALRLRGGHGQRAGVDTEDTPVTRREGLMPESGDHRQGGTSGGSTCRDDAGRMVGLDRSG